MKEIHKKKKEKNQQKLSPSNIQMYLNSNGKSGFYSPRALTTPTHKKVQPSLNTGSQFDSPINKKNPQIIPKEDLFFQKDIKPQSGGITRYLGSLFGCGY